VHPGGTYAASSSRQLREYSLASIAAKDGESSGHTRLRRDVDVAAVAADYEDDAPLKLTFDRFAAMLLGADPTRERRFAEHEATLRQTFGPGEREFRSPMRADLLRASRRQLELPRVAVAAGLGSPSTGRPWHPHRRRAIDRSDRTVLDRGAAETSHPAVWREAPLLG
jgi:hypothetical protein